MKNRVTVEIYGRSYPMTTDESPEYTEKLAATLNERFEKLRAQKRSISIQDAAAVISLECLDELVKNKQTEHNIRTQISAYAEDASESRAEIEKLNKEIARLNERIQQLEREIKLRHQFAADEAPEQIVGNRAQTAQPAQSAKPAQAPKPAQPARNAANTQPVRREPIGHSSYTVQTPQSLRHEAANDTAADTAAAKTDK